MAFGSRSMSSSTRYTGIRVRRASSSSIKLLKSGDRCCTTTNESPESRGVCAKNSSNASRPPAEAPIPTTGWLHGLASPLSGAGSSPSVRSPLAAPSGSDSLGRCG